MNKLPIHTSEYSVTSDGISFDGYYLSKIFHNGYFILTWTSGYTQTFNKQIFDTLEGVERFLSINDKTLKAFKRIKKFVKLI